MKKTVIYFAVLVAALLTGCCNMIAGNPHIGVQLYSARKFIGNPEKYAENHEAVLKGLADMGYETVETASYADGKIYGVTPEQFSNDCGKYGLKPLSTHTTRNLSEEEFRSGRISEKTVEWWNTCIEAHKAAGMKYIVVPSVHFAFSKSNVPHTLAELQTFCDYLNTVGKMVKDAGMEFGYHNHAYEYSKVENEVMYDYMLTHTNPEYVFFEMDVYWTVRGQSSPVDYFRKYPGRFKVLHIKDHREIGQSGMVGFDAIFANAATAGTKDIIVEVEHYSYDDVMKSIAESADYLLNAKFVKAWEKTATRH